MILMVNIHYSRASDIVTPDLLTTDPATRITAYRDGFGNWCSRIVAPIGRIRLKGTGVVERLGSARCSGAPRAAACPAGTSGRYAGISIGQPVLRDRSAVGSGLVALRPIAAGMAARAGHLRFRAPPYRLQLFECAPHSDCLGDVQRAHGRLPGLCAFGHRILPRHEHSSALLHRIPGRHRVPAPLRPNGFCGVDGGISRWSLAHLRSAQQRAQNWARAHRARPRRGGCRDCDHLRPEHPRELSSVDGRNSGKRATPLDWTIGSGSSGTQSPQGW